MEATGDWVGAKAAILFEDRLLTTLRDDLPTIPFPNHWDFVGGGREPGETPEGTLIREGREEIGLDLAAADWVWAQPFPSMTDPAKAGWFFVLRLPAKAARRIAMADEGAGWMLIEPASFLRLPRAVPSLQHRLRVWMGLLHSGPGAP